MKWLRVLFKFVLFIPFIGSYILASLLSRLLSRDLSERRLRYVQIVSWYCGLALKLLNFKYTVKNRPSDDQHYLFVGNHLGFFDIFVLAAIKPSLFITSVDMRETPGLGLLTEMGGCLYVERRNRSNIHNELIQIRETLKAGFNVVLYPEGTSTDGRQVMPFKKTLMTAVAGTGVPIMPMVINFRKANNEPMSDKYRNCIAWYGDISFLEVLVGAFSLKSADIEFEFCEPIHCHTEEDRRHVAEAVYKAVVSKYQPF